MCISPQFPQSTTDIEAARRIFVWRFILFPIPSPSASSTTIPKQKALLWRNVLDLLETLDMDVRRRVPMPSYVGAAMLDKYCPGNDEHDLHAVLNCEYIFIVAHRD